MTYQNGLSNLNADRPELLPEFLCQLVHDGVTVVLDSFEGGQVAVLLQHTPGMAVGLHCLSIGLQLQTLVQPRRQFKQKLQLPQEGVDP